MPSAFPGTAPQTSKQVCGYKGREGAYPMHASFPLLTFKRLPTLNQQSVINYYLPGSPSKLIISNTKVKKLQQVDDTWFASLVSCNCHTKDHILGDLKQCVAILEARSPRSKYPQATLFLMAAVEEDCPLPLLASGIFQQLLTLLALQTYHSRHVDIFSLGVFTSFSFLLVCSVFKFLCLFQKDTYGIGLRPTLMTTF